MRSILRCLGALSTPVLAATACGGNDVAGAPDRPSIVVTTSVLGDVVRAVVGDEADVEVVMPIGADPHEFAPSARRAEAMLDADLLVVNGAGFEEGLAELIDGAARDGTAMFTFADHVATVGGDPHLWTDPTNIARAMTPLAEAVGAIDGVDAGVVGEQAAAVEADLRALDAEIAEALDAIPDGQRVLVTNHEALGAFARRYGLDVVGTVIPSLTTMSSSSAADLEALADVIRERGVPAIFAETTRPTQLAESLADEVADVDVVELYTESLGEPGSGAETYAGMMRVDAALIVGALT